MGGGSAWEWEADRGRQSDMPAQLQTEWEGTENEKEVYKVKKKHIS